MKSFLPFLLQTKKQLPLEKIVLFLNFLKETAMVPLEERIPCIIQINTGEEMWVSDSPYLHVFDGLDTVHHQMEEKALTKTMNEIGYRPLKTDEYLLPNGKKLVMLDFER